MSGTQVEEDSGRTRTRHGPLAFVGNHGQHLNTVCGAYPLIVFGDERAQLECIADTDLKSVSSHIVDRHARRGSHFVGSSDVRKPVAVSRVQGLPNGLAVNCGVVSKQGNGRFGEPRICGKADRRGQPELTTTKVIGKPGVLLERRPVANADVFVKGNGNTCHRVKASDEHVGLAVGGLDLAPDRRIKGITHHQRRGDDGGSDD